MADEKSDSPRARKYQRTPMRFPQKVPVADVLPGETKEYPLHDKVVLRVDRYDDAERGCRMIEVALCNDKVTSRKIPVDTRILGTDLWTAHRESHKRNFERRFSEAAAKVDAHSRLTPPRYWLVHTLAHVLIRELAMTCGYSAASLSERLYAWTAAPGRAATAALLICTTASDSDGTLGGLVRNAADHASAPRTGEVAAHLRPGIVLRTRDFDGGYVRNHAKFLAVDHRFLLVTSADFSWSAEHGNVERGLLADNANLVQVIESEMRRVEDAVYERVAP